ncbi:MAG: hypothetical protein RLZZ175_2685 [Bacteroidota bacterium]|jgi:Flp pilus assembly protein TadD
MAKHLNTKNQNSTNQKNTESANKKEFNPLIALLFLLAVTFIVYAQCFNFEFITKWDDDFFVTKNPFITQLSWANIKSIFSTTVLNMYSPLTVLSFAIEHALVGLKPFLYHFDNVILHLLNTYILFKITQEAKLSHWAGLFIAAIFALHPMHIESVAWVTERKDVLYCLFYLLAWIQYIKYLHTENNKNLYLTILYFVLSCLAKPMAITLPIILIATHLYISKSFNSKHYFAIGFTGIIGFVFGILPFLILTKEQLTDNLTPLFSVSDRFFLFCYSIGFYVFQFFIPNNLTAFHYYPEKINNSLPTIYYLSPLAIIAIASLFFFVKNNRKVLVFGAIVFLGSLSLVLKLVPFGNAITAERYTYFAYIALAWIVAVFIDKIENKSIKNGILVGICFILSIMSFQRIKVWKNNITLFSDVIEKSPTNATPYTIRAESYDLIGDKQAALQDYTKAISLSPTALDALFNRAVIYFQLNDFQSAVNDFNAYEKAKNNFPLLYLNRAKSYSNLKEFDKAISDFNKYLNTEPNDYEALNQLGLCYYNLKDYKNAIAQYDKSIVLSPNFTQALINRGNAKAYSNDLKGSLNDYNSVLSIEPNDDATLSNRGNTYYLLGDKNSACNDWKKAAELGNESAKQAVIHVCR